MCIGAGVRGWESEVCKAVCVVHGDCLWSQLRKHPGTHAGNTAAESTGAASSFYGPGSGQALPIRWSHQTLSTAIKWMSLLHRGKQTYSCMMGVGLSDSVSAQHKWLSFA